MRVSGMVMNVFIILLSCGDAVRTDVASLSVDMLDGITQTDVQTGDCVVIIDQGGGSFTGYAFEPATAECTDKKDCKAKEVAKCKSKAILKKDQGLVDPDFAEPGGTFLDYSGSVVNGTFTVDSVVKYLTSLYDVCLDNMLKSDKCSGFSKVSVYQTGKMRAKALVESAKAKEVRELWTRTMQAEMETRAKARETSESYKFYFEFIANSKEATLEGLDFFGEGFEDLANALPERLNAKKVIAFGIGSSSTQAYAYAKNSGLVQGTGNERLGVKPLADGTPEVPYDDMPSAFLRLMKDATGLEVNDGSYEAIVAINAIGYNVKLVHGILQKCCGVSSRLEGTCQGPDLEVGAETKLKSMCALAEDKFQIKEHKQMDVADVATLSRWASAHYKPSEKEAKKEGPHPPKILNSLAEAARTFKVEHIVLDDTKLPGGGHWVNELVDSADGDRSLETQCDCSECNCWCQVKAGRGSNCKVKCCTGY